MTAKPISIKLTGGKSGGCASKAVELVQDAEAYQRLLDIAAQADVLEGIRQGLEDVRKGHSSLGY